MHLRPMQRDDLPTVADISTVCFAPDELYSWIHPSHAEHPGDLRRSLLLRYKKRFIDQGSYTMVCVTDQDDPEWNGSSEVVAHAFWVRTSQSQVDWEKNTWGMKLERTLLDLWQWYDSRFLSKSLSKERLEAYLQATDFKFYNALTEYYHLAVLAVLQDFRRRGIATKLLKWGMDRAREEEVPVTLEASKAGRKLYEKEGFRTIEEAEVYPGLVGVAMLWEPEHKRGHWIVDQEEEPNKAKLKTLE